MAKTRLSWLCVLVLMGVVGAAGEEGADKFRLETPEGWKQERIALPPSFAPRMELKGFEEIRFAPGMFNATSDTFFSYVLVFQVALQPKLTPETLQREFLVYYQGLAQAVLKGSDVAVNADRFTLKLVAIKEAGLADGLRRFQADLKWIEPFATRKPQTLHLELDIWQNAATKKNLVFVCASPKDATAEIWSQMRKIRAGFQKQQLQ